MNMLVEELAAVAANPLAWGAVGVLALFAVYALWHWQSCPLLHGRARIDPAEAEARVSGGLVDGPRFFLLMLGGIAATLAGLTFIAEGRLPTLAFYLLIAGVFVMQTEPARRQVREAEFRAVAATLRDEEAQAAALARLRASHLWLVALHFLIFAAAIVALLAF